MAEQVHLRQTERAEQPTSAYSWHGVRHQSRGQLVLSVLGADRVWHYRDLDMDPIRRGDEAVSCFIQNRLSKLPPGETVRCLEIGAGCTYSFSGICNNPSLSRRLASVHNPALDLTATDLNSVPLWIFVNAEKMAYIGWFDGEVVESPLLSPIRRNSHGQVTFDSLPVKDVISAYGADRITRSIEYFEHNAKVNVRGGSVYVRPSLDTELEQALFGLKALGGIDVNEIPKAFPATRFDLIFGRYLPHGIVRGNANYPSHTAYFRAILKETGMARFSYEQTCFVSGGHWSSEWSEEYKNEIDGCHFNRHG